MTTGSGAACRIWRDIGDLSHEIATFARNRVGKQFATRRLPRATWPEPKRSLRSHRGLLVSGAIDLHLYPLLALNASVRLGCHCARRPFNNQQDCPQWCNSRLTRSSPNSKTPSEAGLCQTGGNPATGHRSLSQRRRTPQRRPGQGLRRRALPADRARRDAGEGRAFQAAAPLDYAPFEVIQHLAWDDEIEVAGNVLANSSRLGTERWSRSPAARDRTTCSPSPAGPPARRRHRRHRRSRRNQGHPQAGEQRRRPIFQDPAFPTIVAHSADDDELVEILGLRLDLPMKFLRRPVAPRQGRRPQPAAGPRTA